MNQATPPTKLSTADVRLNLLVGTIFLIDLVCVLLLAMGGAIWVGVNGASAWYLGLAAGDETGVVFINRILSFFVLAAWLVPMSLFVTLEMARFIQARHIEWDKHLKLESRGQLGNAYAKTSSLTDELGVIQVVFSDKTGTLTENQMIFRRAYVTANGSNGLQVGSQLPPSARSRRHPSQSARATPMGPAPQTISPGALTTSRPSLFRSAVSPACTAYPNPVPGSLSLVPDPDVGIKHPAGIVPPSALSHLMPSVSSSTAQQPSAAPAQPSHQITQSQPKPQPKFARASLAAVSQLLTPNGNFLDDSRELQTRLFLYSLALCHDVVCEDLSVIGSASPTSLRSPSVRPRSSSDFASPLNTGSASGNMCSPLHRDAGESPDVLTVDDPFAFGLPPAPSTIAPASAPRIRYAASSPDELALVQAAKAQGIVLVDRSSDRTVLWTAERGFQTWTVLGLIPFTSDRKRMSVLVRAPWGQHLVLCKGADSSVLPLCSGVARMDVPSAMTDDWVTVSTDHDIVSDEGRAATAALTEYSVLGLRTLVFSVRPLSSADASGWAQRWEAARGVIGPQREQELVDAAAELESNLALLGVSAIEDKLQDGVPETLHALLRAGIRVWMLTGDKTETAISIAHSCRLISRSTPLVTLTSGDVESSSSGSASDTAAEVAALIEAAYAEHVTARLRAAHRWHEEGDDSSDVAPDDDDDDNDGSVPTRFRGRGRHTTGRGNQVTAAPANAGIARAQGRRAGPSHRSAVVQAAEMRSSLNAAPALVIDGKILGIVLHHCSDQFVSLARQCSAVVCCRVAPIQKALVVKLMRQRCGYRTLAIGDGSNDIAMIQSAHVGVGIAGKEGLQASRASDFSIAQFRFLRRLMFVHGRYNHVRVAELILYSLYKNFGLVLGSLLFALVSGFSSQTLVESWLLFGYNLIFTLLPIFVVALTEKDAPERVVLSTAPESYAPMLKAGLITSRRIFLRLLEISLQVVLIVVACALAYLWTGGAVAGNGQTGGLFAFGTLYATILLIVVTARLALSTRSWTTLFWVSVAVSAASVAVWFLVLNTSPAFTMEMLGTVGFLLRSPPTYLLIVTLSWACLVPYIFIRTIQRHVHPSTADIVRRIGRIEAKGFRTRRTPVSMADADVSQELIMSHDLMVPPVRATRA
jgi:magnesium-transporting ATPase (P-type)